MIKSERQFEQIRAAYARVQVRRDTFRSAMLSKYGRHDPSDAWMTRGEKLKRELIKVASDRAIDRMCDLLDVIGCRDWRTGVPAHWLVESLTYADAVTTGALSVVPPLAYGGSAARMRVFCAATDHDIVARHNDNLSSDHAEEPTYMQSVCIEDACEDHASVAPAYPEVGSGTGDRFDGLTIGTRVRVSERCSYRPGETGTVVEIVDARGSLPTAVYVRIDHAGLSASFQPGELEIIADDRGDARICGRCERPLAPYAIDDRARYPYRAGDQCSCDSPQPIAIMGGSSVLGMITAHRAIAPDPEPIDGLTYTDADGAERSAEEYVSRDRGDAPCSRYGTRHQYYLPWVLAHARILAESCGELTSDSLDGCISDVVNDSDGPAYFVCAHGTDAERAQLLPELSADSLDALQAYMIENSYEPTQIVQSAPDAYVLTPCGACCGDVATPRESEGGYCQTCALALDGYDLDSFVEGFVTAALWSDCEHVQTYAVDVSGDDDASDSGMTYEDAVTYVNALADDLESDGWTCDRGWASADNHYAVAAGRGDDARTIAVVRDEDPGSGGCEDLTLDDDGETIVRAYCARFVTANRADLNAYGEQRSYDPSQGSVESYAGHDLYLTAVGHGTGFWDRGLGELGDRLTTACGAFEDVTDGLGMVDNGDGTASLIMPGAYGAR